MAYETPNKRFDAVLALPMIHLGVPKLKLRGQIPAKTRLG
jgi:hypothetical protein